LDSFLPLLEVLAFSSK
jgi:hypothetical protein